MGDAKRRQGNTVSAVSDKRRDEKQAQKARRQRPELFQRYALGIFQKHLLLHFKTPNGYTPNAIQRIVEGSRSCLCGQEAIDLCMNDSKSVAITRQAEFDLLLDTLVSDMPTKVNLDGHSFILGSHQQRRFRSFSKGIDLKMHKQIARDCLSFLFSKEASQTLEHLFAYFVDHAIASMREAQMLPEDRFSLAKRIWVLADHLLMIEILTIPWVEEFELIQKT